MNDFVRFFIEQTIFPKDFEKEFRFFLMNDHFFRQKSFQNYLFFTKQTNLMNDKRLY